MPGWNAVFALAVAALAVMGSPGPATISIAAVGAAFGWQRALGYLAGLVLGTTTVLVIIATGLTGVLFSVPALAPVLVALSLAYILWLAWRIATAPPLSAPEAAAMPPPLIGGYLLGIANPKAYFAIAAVFATGHLAATPLADSLAKVAVLTVMILVIHLAWLALGTAFAGVLRDPKRSRIVNVAMAVALLAASLAALAPRG
jgi:threonine/homoserine/homoserine lactone efflux protein